VAIILPFVPVLQLTLVGVACVIVGAFGVIIVYALVLVQFFASVTVTVNVPAFKLLNTLLIWFVDPILYAYVGVPPVDVIVSVPSLPGTHVGVVLLTFVICNAVGCVSVMLVVFVQLLPSVTVIV
jgi:hypothetical protein